MIPIRALLTTQVLCQAGRLALWSGGSALLLEALWRALLAGRP